MGGDGASSKPDQAGELVLKRASLPQGSDTGGFFNDSGVDFFGVHTSGVGSNASINSLLLFWH
jgi:hypothetical protein